MFVTRGSANADLADPEVSASCDGDNVVITSNGIPDYTYIETSPGSPAAGNYTFTIPATPTMADEATDVPDLGTAAVALGGVPIYGPTEGTGGDVLSLAGALSGCGSHNGSTGFHIHQILTSGNTDCLFTPEAVASGPQLVGYAFDGYPIYTGIDQYTSSWELTDESLFATDTWAAHSYVEGLGDLDQCNGLTDADGNYAYYTTETFPFVIGCYAGVVDLAAGLAGGAVVRDAVSGSDDSAHAPSDADIGFCTDMSTHHVQALAMCQRVLGRDTGDAVQAAASEVLQTRAIEVGMVRAWLTDWSQSTSPPTTVMAWMGLSDGAGMPAAMMPRLTALHGYSDLYAKGMLDDEAIERAMQRMGSESTGHADGEVLVELTADDTHLEISVVDHGPGIDEDDRERIFQPFVRLDASRTRTGTAGAGLGLTLTNQISASHHGTISVGDTPGGGATITLRFPRV